MNLIEKDLIFKEDFASLAQAFKCLSKRFLERGLVKQGYLEALMEREKNYPTGIDLISCISRVSEYSNTAYRKYVL